MTAQHAAAAAAAACVLCMHAREHAVHATCSITATIYHQLNAADMRQPQQQRHYINHRHPLPPAALQPLSVKRTAEAPTIHAPNYIFSDGRYVPTAHSGHSTCARDLDTPSRADG